MDRSGRIDMLLNMLVQEPEDLFLNYALGVEYAAALSLKDAERQFKKVLAMDEHYLAAYYQMGKLFESQLQNNLALQYYKTGLEKASLKKDQKAINEFGEAVFMLEED